MADALEIPSPERTGPVEVPLRQNQMGIRPVLALASITALVCSSLEVELLEQLDSLSLYMTYREIALDAAVALLFLLAAVVMWWICILAIAVCAGRVFREKRYRQRLVWQLGLGIPLSYFVLVLFDSLRLRFIPQWHPELGGWMVLGFGILVLCVGGLSITRLSTIQEFCRVRLAPLGWLHMSAAPIIIVVLWAHGVYLFKDYAHTNKAVTASELPDIYLITLDALRAEDMSVYGYYRPTTPGLQRFAQRSFTFDYFFANSNFTTATTTSIETGKLPWSHRVFQLGGFLRGEAQRENLAELLRQRGYYTAMITANYAAAPFKHRTLSSYDAVEFAESPNGSGKWMHYTNLIGLNTQHTLTISILKTLNGAMLYLGALMGDDNYPYPAEAVFNRARALLARPDIKQPRFVWTHIFAPHDPYLPPIPFRSRFLSTDKLTHSYNFLRLRNTAPPPGVSTSELRARYDELLCYADHSVEDYLDWLDQTGRLDRSIVIVSADHGESFEHNWIKHSGPFLYNGLVHIPLMIHLPGQREGARVNQTAQQADLLPTILELVGGPVPGWTDGRSLKPALVGGTLSEQPVFSMNLEPDRSAGQISKGTISMIDGEFKYINYLATHREELYRYRTDGPEEHNLIGVEPEIAKRMRDALLNKLGEVNKPDAPQR
jgi:arylsulfatase A-like enzyme